MTMSSTISSPGALEVPFSLPEGGVDSIVSSLRRHDPTLPAFVYERIDPITREALTTWIGIDVEEVERPGGVGAFDALREELRALRAERSAESAGGVFAFVAHPAPADLPTGPVSGTPDAVLLRLSVYVRIDHASQMARVIQVGDDFASARRWAELCAAATEDAVDVEEQEASYAWTPTSGLAEFTDAVQAFQSGEGEAAGVEGVVLSVQMTSRRASDATASYRALRAMNPSTCMFLLRRTGFELWGATSLSLVQIRDRRLVAETDGATHPIPDMPDGQAYIWTPTPKELSEYDVVADALWEDVAGVAAPGTEMFTREREQRVFFNLGHLFAEIQAEIGASYAEVAVVAALSPHGAAVGHPRREALELISRLEPVARGPFAGVIGMFETNGDTDAAAVTRSMWTTPDGSVVHAGAKVVAGSVAADEYHESVLKTRALRESARMTS
jgi:anthranilate synthase component 1